MKKKNPFIMIILFLIATLIPTFSKEKQVTSVKECIPTFEDGDGPYYLPNAPYRNVFGPTPNGAITLRVSGKVLQKDCKTPAANIILDLWQASNQGIYVNEWYRGRVTTDDGGNYSFQTVMPKGYGEGTGERPPHIHFKVWDKEKLLITSEMFFPDVKGRDGFNDAYIVDLSTTTSFGRTTANAHHNIILP